MRSGQARATFVDCAVHGAGSGAELFVVEGESAAASVSAVRRTRDQAVLPLQGKPMNAWRASAAKVQAHALYAQFAQALGLAHATALDGAALDGLAGLRFERIVLLMDPDADGIHIGALMLLYVQRWAPALIEGERIAWARAPMFTLRGPDESVAPQLAFNPTQCHERSAAMTARDGAAPRVQAVRGLGSLAPALLSQLCVDPATRSTLRVVTPAEVRAVIDVFGRVGD